MSTLRLFVYTTLAMLAFAANSLLCRLALKQTAIDAASFTSVRILSGALLLWLLLQTRTATHGKRGSWRSAAALFIYVLHFLSPISPFPQERAPYYCSAPCR
jgi:hypothetical protein